MLYEELASEIIAAAVEAHKIFRSGMLESAFEESLCFFIYCPKKNETRKKWRKMNRSGDSSPRRIEPTTLGLKIGDIFFQKISPNAGFKPLLKSQSVSFCIETFGENYFPVGASFSPKRKRFIVMLFES